MFVNFFGKENCIQKKGKEYCDIILKDTPENYSFIPLQGLKPYLEANQHLPRLPGEALTGNVDTAEIDRLLLEKLEESHIYIIELNDKLTQQQEQIDELNSRLQVLEPSLAKPQNSASSAQIPKNF